jgi:hypothetical protein
VYSQSISSGTFPSGATIQAQNPGGVRFTGSFSPGSNLTFRGIVVINSDQKELGSSNVFEDMSFVGGPSCGNTVNVLIGSNTTIRRSAIYGRGGRYQVLAYQVSNVTMEDVIIRSDGGWGQGGSGCTEFEPNAAMNFYNSNGLTCRGCILFDGITQADGSSELIGGLGVNCHITSGNSTFENSLIVNSQRGFWADGLGTCNSQNIINSASYASDPWGFTRNVQGTTTLTNFSTDGNCGGFKGNTTLVNSKVTGSNSGCSGGTNGAGATLALNTTFLNNPRWRQEMCTDAGVTRGWCGTALTLSEYLLSFP